MRAKRSATILSLGLALTISRAFATTYTTSGCFSVPTVNDPSTSAAAVCSATGSTLLFDDLAGSETITFTDGSSTPGPGGVIDLGTFQISSSGSGSGNGFGATFSINFTSPLDTAGTFSATLTGSLSGSAPSATLLFSPSTQTFSATDGTFEVTLQTTTLQLSASNAVETLYGNVADVPEPRPVALLGGGLTVLALATLRGQFRRA
ncbi:MAG: hypothetical protein JO051_01715 [Acidobacteriaceae bacterium]|nr:hypothetical protein [Acidobacteriaceae bacterium]